VLVRDPTGAEIKRTIVGKGKHPTFEDSFMVPLTTQALEFVILDKEGGIFKKNDDVVGGGWWRCAEIAKTLKQPFESTSYGIIKHLFRCFTKAGMLEESSSKCTLLA